MRLRVGARGKVVQDLELYKNFYWIITPSAIIVEIHKLKVVFLTSPSV